MVEFIRKVLPDGTIQRVQIGADAVEVTQTIPAIDITDIEAIKTAAMESLVLMMQTMRGDVKSLAIVREVLDRYVGKPVQPIAQKIDMRVRRTDDAGAELASMSVEKLREIKRIMSGE